MGTQFETPLLRRPLLFFDLFAASVVGCRAAEDLIILNPLMITSFDEMKSLFEKMRSKDGRS